MSATLGEASRVRITTGSVMLPVEVRNHQLRLVDRGVSGLALQLAPGTYVVSAPLPDGRQVARAVQVHAAADQTVDLGAELDALVWTARHPSDLAVPAPGGEPGTVPPERALQFLRLRSLDKAVADQSPVVEEVRRWSGGRSVLVRVPDRGVYFARITRAGQTPLHVALPAGGGDACLLTVEEHAGAPRVAAVPAHERVRYVSEYLAGGDAGHAALLLAGGEAGAAHDTTAGPVGAAVAAYVRLRLGRLDAEPTGTEDLAVRADWFPDGAVVAGEELAMRGDHDRAAAWFLEAGDRGLPVFTDGFSILVARLRQYQANQRIRGRLAPAQVARIRMLSARLERWSPFVDLGALTLTVTAPELVQPVESREIPLRPEPEQHAIPIAPLIRRLARAANDAVHDRPAPVSSEWASSEAGLRCVHREAGPDQVEIIIEWTRPVAEPSAVHVRVTTAGTTVEYLVILTLEASGRWAGDLLIRGAGESVATVVLGLRATASLEADDVEAVRRSVNVTARAGRNAWRAVARARPHGDPVRQAIVTALQH